MILFSASYHRGTPSADLRAYRVCDRLRASGVEAEAIGPADGVSYCRERVLSLGPEDMLYVQKWSGQLHNVSDLSRCRARIVYDFDDLTSSAKHKELVKRCSAFVVGTKSLVSQVQGKPVLVAPTPIEPELFGDPVPYDAREPGVVVAKYGMKPYLGKLADLAPMLVPMLERYGHKMWFLGAHRPAEHQRLQELYPGCRVYPLVKMGRFYDVQVPIIKAARWGFVPYDKRCRGKSATSALTLMACGVPCFAEGTLVLTKDGYRPIESVSVGDEVLTHRGRWRSVIATMSRRNIDLRMVQAQGVPNVVTTDDHPFYAKLKKRVWDNDLNSTKREFSAPVWTQAADLSKHHFVAQVMPKVRRSDHGDNFWWLVGRYLADGWFTDYQSGGKRFRRTTICCSKEEKDLLRQRIENAGFHVGEPTNEPTAFKFHIYDRELFDFLQPFGRYAHGKLIPGYVFGLSRSKTTALLDGYFSGDGCTCSNAKGNGTHMKATTVSKALALSIALLAQRAFGVVASIQRYQAKPGKTIEGRAVSQREQFMVCVPRINRVAFVNSGYGWKRVVRTKPCGIGKVWNISVDEDESYMADGAIVHNCQAFAFGNCEEMFGRRLRRWVVRDNKRFMENAERFMSDPIHGERFLKVCEERVSANSLGAHCERLLTFFGELEG